LKGNYIGDALLILVGQHAHGLLVSLTGFRRHVFEARVLFTVENDFGEHIKDSRKIVHVHNS
jgi:hypothetical protein